MKRNTLKTDTKGIKSASRNGLPYLYIGILILLAVALFSGCSLSEKTSNEPVILEPSEFTYSVSTSAVPIQISSGNLHWHRELPNESYTLEDMAVEIHNLGDFDISVAQLEIMVDEDARLFTINQVIAGGARENITLQPMMAGYDGGVHRVHLSLLGDNGGVLYQNEGEDIGPLEPEPGTGSWHSMPS
jgi:hypothetical protein